MKLLVTGGAGFIGSAFLLEETLAHPDDVFVCLDALTYAGNPDWFLPLAQRKNFLFVKGDIRDAKTVFRLFESFCFDRVVNFAAESHVDNSIKRPGLFFETNVLGTEALLSALKATNPKGVFHQISTDEVYGDVPFDYRGEGAKETDPLHPSSPYAASKASADLLVQSFGRTYGLSYLITRSANNFGPRQYREKLIPTVIAHALENSPIPVYGTGKNVRDWLYVNDHVKALDALIYAKKPLAFRIYNITAHHPLSNLDLIHRILMLLHKPDTLISFVPDRLGHDRAYAMDASRLKEEGNAGFDDRFDQDLASTVRWYSERQERKKQT